MAIQFVGGITEFPNQTFILGEDVDVQIPEAESDAGGINYTLSPALSGGITFDNMTLRITGVPKELVHGVLYRVTATDAAADSVYLEFRIFVRATPYTLGNEDLISLLPPNATEWERAVEMMLRDNILPVDENMHIRMPILDAWNPNTVPEHLIPYLGINLSMNVDTALPVESQRELLRKSYDIHSYEGTPQALLDVIFALGYDGAVIVEGATDENGDAHWSNYAICLNENISIDRGQILIELVKDLAPVRCRLVGVDVSSSNQLWDGSILFDGTHAFGNIVPLGVNL